MTNNFSFRICSLLVILCSSSYSQATKEFATWLDGLRQEARKQGISQKILDAALTDLTPLPTILTHQRKQPEKTHSLTSYLNMVVSRDRVIIAKRKLQEHRELLERISEKYRVQPRFLVALWAMESDFGRNSGSIPVISALATLAYQGRRADYFRRELLVALKILEREGMSTTDLKGSWAGAMGQCQFMPWSYSRRAVDFDGDGHRDIWESVPDVLASIANYLASQGWNDDLTWGREVRLPPGFDEKLLNGSVRKKLAEWQSLGVRRADGRDLPERNITARLVRPSRSGGRTYITYANFDVLMKWNNSSHFGIAVGRLSDLMNL